MYPAVSVLCCDHPAVGVRIFQLIKSFLFQVWSHKEYPLIPVGKMVLNRNPVNYFAEVEQLAFDPSNMPPGIEPSPDKMLQVTNSILTLDCFSVRLT